MTYWMWLGEQAEGWHATERVINDMLTAKLPVGADLTDPQADE